MMAIKNSEMEMSIRTNRSAAISSAINQQFYNLIKLSEQPNKMNELGYQTTVLLQDIEEQLPNLPTTRKTQAITAQSAVENPINESQQDWKEVSAEINQRIQQAITLFEKGENKKAMLSVHTYFDVFENSGMENKIGARDSNFKAELESYFTKLVGLIKANSNKEKIQEQANLLNQALTKAVDMLQTDNTGGWILFIASFTIILREGLEALLIVAAIVTYLVKNNHQKQITCN